MTRYLRLLLSGSDLMVTKPGVIQRHAMKNTFMHHLHSLANSMLSLIDYNESMSIRHIVLCLMQGMRGGA